MSETSPSPRGSLRDPGGPPPGGGEVKRAGAACGAGRASRSSRNPRACRCRRGARAPRRHRHARGLREDREALPAPQAAPARLTSPPPGGGPPGSRSDPRGEGEVSLIKRRPGRRRIQNRASDRSRSKSLKDRGWQKAGSYEDIVYETWDGIAKITINRPEVRNAFRPTTVSEMSRAFEVARDDPEVGVVILTGAGTEAFCSGGDQRIRGDDGYVDPKGIGRLNVLDLQIQIRRLPKPVVAMVAGYAIGGGHVLHVVCDLTVAADNARFGQTGPRVGSFDGGYGAGFLARI